jgi:hypothetical protein
MAEASGSGFKKILEEMDHLDRLNFIWMYDQYVQTVCDVDIDAWQVVPDTIEEFYHNTYKPQIQEGFKRSCKIMLDQGH